MLLKKVISKVNNVITGKMLKQQKFQLFFGTVIGVSYRKKYS